MSKKYLGNELIRTEGIEKSFGPTKALKDISFKALHEGEIRGLVGENGAGKTVFISILAGILRPDKGSIYWHGKRVTFNSPSDAMQLGISVVHQGTDLVPEMSVANNIFLGREKKTIGRIVLDDKKLQDEAGRLIDEFFGIVIDPSLLVEELDVVAQKVIQVTRALSRGTKLLIFDEATAQMTEKEKHRLFYLIRKLSNSRVGTIFISHILEEVLNVADTITIFRNGEEITTSDKDEITLPKLIKMMTGSEKGLSFPLKTTPSNDILFSVYGLTVGNRLKEVSFDLRYKEIVGIMGLRGQGKEDLLRAIFGIIPKKIEKMLLKGKTVTTDSPFEAVKNKIAFLSDKRDEEGMFLTRPAIENLNALHWEVLSNRAGIINHEQEVSQAERAVRKYDVRTSSLGSLGSSLSGGNKQKLLVARLALAEPDLFLLCNPTYGVDVGAKNQIYHYIAELATLGKGVLMTSDDINEVVNLCHRVIIIRNGMITNILPATVENSHEILREVYESVEIKNP